MFRALLWKEWRELWILPVAAAPLTAVILLLTQPRQRPLDPETWILAFAMLLLLAALFIPTILYARGRNIHDSQFPLLIPLDRFRRWWFMLIIGLSIVAAVGVVLYGTTTVLTHFYRRLPAFEHRLTEMTLTVICIAVSLFSFSAFISAFFKKQVPASVAVMLAVFVLWVSWLIVSVGVEPVKTLVKTFEKDPNYWRVCFLVFCPGLLFASMAVYVRKDFRKRTRRRVALGYSAAALAALVPTAAGAAYLSRGIMEAFKPSPPRIMGMDISGDGNRMVFNISPGKVLISVDLIKRRAYRIDKGGSFDVRMKDRGDAFVYSKTKSILSSKVILSNFEGTRKKIVSTNSFLSYISVGFWSKDGAYFGMINSEGMLTGGRKTVVICDSTGKILGEYEFPALEEAWIFPIGWDNKQRFYFFKNLNKRGTTITTYWRVKPDDIAPEQVSFLRQDHSYYMWLSPDGRWATGSRRLDDSGKRELWLYDIAQETSLLVSQNWASFKWSHDGAIFAFLEDVVEQDDEDATEELPRRLILYRPETGARTSVLLGDALEIDSIQSWSLSNAHLLLISKGYKRRYVFSIDTKLFQEIPRPSDKFIYLPKAWIADERLLWIAKTGLVATEYDGSNPKEIFRVEGGKFYFDGKEKP